MYRRQSCFKLAVSSGDNFFFTSLAPEYINLLPPLPILAECLDPVSAVDVFGDGDETDVTGDVA